MGRDGIHGLCEKHFFEAMERRLYNREQLVRRERVIEKCCIFLMRICGTRGLFMAALSAILSSSYACFPIPDTHFCGVPSFSFSSS